jgi:hypothetical protein
MGLDSGAVVTRVGVTTEGTGMALVDGKERYEEGARMKEPKTGISGLLAE